ncbi:MAG: GIY-YIG nuclease family protein [Propionibacteriaceae bacterium]|nr:GIY-YIG nuclease family protein [Propionibacteriaceae bacterium]
MTSQPWDRYEVAGPTSLAPLFRDRGCGIYVLEFADGQYYVGKTTRALQRFTTHVRHWGDVSAILFRDVSNDDLDRVERETIADRRRAGWTLRNIKHNLGHEQPSSLDEVLAVVEQRHWALGHAEYDVAPFAVAAGRGPQVPTKLSSSRLASQLIVDEVSVADAVLLDLAAVIEVGIPEALATERDYWTISDYPSTAGGRLATLNVGDMEVLYFPRETIQQGQGPVNVAVLNTAPGHDLPEEIAGGWVERGVEHYRAAEVVDQVIVPLGRIGAALDDERTLAAVRTLVLALMRSSTSAKFARWHSAELARRAFEVIANGVDGRA